MDSDNKGSQRAKFNLLRNSAKNNYIAVLQREDMLGTIFFLSIRWGEAQSEEGGERRKWERAMEREARLSL